MASQPVSQAQISANPQPRIMIVMNNVGTFFLKYWTLILTTFFGLVVLTALGAPILTYFGLDALAYPIFHACNWLCGQIPSHSFYIGGHQVGLCVHCLAIYGSLFVGSLLFTWSRKRLRGIPWWVFVLMALPLAYDGFSQMFGLRQSTWEIRLLTGALFGLGAVWFALPLLQKGLMETIPAPTYHTHSGTHIHA